MTARSGWSGICSVLFAALWIAGSLAGNEPRGELIPPSCHTVLSENSWTVPLADLVELSVSGSGILTIALGSVFVASLSRQIWPPDSWQSVIGLSGLSLLLRPESVLVGGILMAIIAVRTNASQSYRGYQSLALVLGAIGITLDFSLPLGVATLTIVEDLLDRTRPIDSRRMAPIGILLVGIILASILLPGFWSAALRPLTALYSQAPSNMIPSLSGGGLSARHGLLVGLVIVTRLSNWRQTNGFNPAVWAALTGWLAILAPRYAVPWITIWLLLSVTNKDKVIQVNFGKGLARISGLLVAGLYCGISIGWTTILAGQSAPRSLSPELWNVEGRVVLIDLDRSSEWREPSRRQRFPLLLDDRWDSWPGQVNGYFAFCNDLMEVRDQRYRRVDGHWGGYKQDLARWKPSLLVVPTSSLSSIRSLSLSRDWKIMGLDGQQVIFSNVAEESNLPQMNQALNCLMTLEWPTRLDQFTLDNTIVTGNSVDDRIVADAICALRFPYAALRFARHDRTDLVLRAHCLLELAHRVSSNASTGSLLDQFRAATAVHEALRQLPKESIESRRLQRGLSGVLAKTRHFPDEIPTPEQPLRSAFLSGDFVTAQLQVNITPAPLNDYYSVILGSPIATAEELVSDLSAVIQQFNDQVPDRIRAEAQFYLGCAALESGQVEIAVPAFLESSRIAPNHLFRDIRNLHLQQLLRNQ